MAQFEEVGVEAVIVGLDKFLAGLTVMNGAITGLGAAGIIGAAGLGLVTAGALAIGAAVVGAVAIIGGLTIGVAALGKTSVETATSMESAFAGVLKTTRNLGTNLFDLTDVGEQVFQDFRDLTKEIPRSFEQLADIGAFAGQLGIADEQIAGFTKTVAALEVSTNLAADDAALGLARIGQIFGTTIGEMSENTERLGSSIVFLGNNFRATEEEILLGARNIAGTAALFETTQADILGIGVAMAEAGVRAEAGGTSVQRAFTLMNEAVVEGGEELDIFAELTGNTAEDFAQLWRGDATEAFVQFVEGLERSGPKATLALKELGLGSVRSQRTLLGLANISQRLRQAIEESNTAFRENTALTREAEIRYSTWESQIEITKNNIRDMGLTIGLELIPILQGLLEKIRPVIDDIGEGLGPAMETIGGVIEKSLLPSLKDLLGAFGIEVPDDLTQAVIDLGESVGRHIENLANFVDEIVELLDAFNEGGIDSILEHFGIEQDTAETFLAVGAGIATFAASLGILLLAIGALAVLPGITLALASLFETIAIGALIIGAPVFLLAAAIALLVGVIIKFGASAKENFLKLKDQVIEIFGLLPGFIKGKFEELVSQTSEVLGLLKDVVVIKFNEVKDGIVEFFTDLNNTWRENWEKLELILSTVWDNMKEAVVTKFEEIRSAITEKINQIQADFGLTEEIKERWRTIWEDIQLITEEVWQRLREIVVEQIGLFSTSIVESLEPIKEDMIMTWESIKQSTSEAWISIKDSILIPLAELGLQISETFEQLKFIIATKWEEIKIITDLALLAISLSISEAFVPIETTWRENWEKLQLILSLVWDNLKEIIREKSIEILENIIGWIEDVLKIIEEDKKWKDAGKAMMDGLLQGLKNNVGQIIDFITRLAERVIGAIKNALGIKSPSTLFAEIGENIVKGLTKGITDKAFEPEVAIENVSNQIVNAGSELLPFGGGGNTAIDRSFNVGDITSTTQPQSANTIASDLALIAALG